MNYNVKEQHFYPSKLINKNQFNKLNTQENERRNSNNHPIKSILNKT